MGHFEMADLSKDESQAVAQLFKLVGELAHLMTRELQKAFQGFFRHRQECCDAGHEYTFSAPPLLSLSETSIKVPCNLKKTQAQLTGHVIRCLYIDRIVCSRLAVDKFFVNRR